jgi:hypothetical protein
MKITPNKIVWFECIYDHIMDVAEQYFHLYDYCGEITINQVYGDGSIDFKIIQSEVRYGYDEDVIYYKTIPSQCFCTDDWYIKVKTEVDHEKQIKKAREERDILDKLEREKTLKESQDPVQYMKS